MFLKSGENMCHVALGSEGHGWMIIIQFVSAFEHQLSRKINSNVKLNFEFYSEAQSSQIIGQAERHLCYLRTSSMWFLYTPSRLSDGKPIATIFGLISGRQIS